MYFTVQWWTGTNWSTCAKFDTLWHAEQFIAAVSDAVNHYRIQPDNEE